MCCLLVVLRLYFEPVCQLWSAQLWAMMVVIVCRRATSGDVKKKKKKKKKEDEEKNIPGVHQRKGSTPDIRSSASYETMVAICETILL